jgi:hypothetical protein
MNYMDNIRITVLPAAQMRYDTWGDWFYAPGPNGSRTLHIQISDVVPKENQFLIAFHELVEVKLCEARGITQKQIDDFDMVKWPEIIKGESADGLTASVGWTHDDEPGDHPEAPYRREHRFAMLLEHMMAHELGVYPYGNVT